jgi:peroxiredoxin
MNKLLQGARSFKNSWVAAILILGLMVVNLLLAKQNFAMRRELNIRAETFNPTTKSLKQGEVVASIVGVGLDGRPYDLSYARDERKRLLLYFSPTCTYCVQQAPLWRNILNQVDASRVEVLGLVSDELNQRAVYTHAEELGYFKTKTPLPIIFTSNELLARYKLVATPTTLLISQHGTVEHVWVGKWDETKTNEVAAALEISGKAQ